MRFRRRRFLLWATIALAISLVLGQVNVIAQLLWMPGAVILGLVLVELGVFDA